MFLLHAGVVKGGAVGTIGLFDVLEETLTDEGEETAGLQTFAVLHLVCGLQHFGEQFVVRGAVFGEAFVVNALKQLLFAGEVHAHEFNHLIEFFGDLIAALTTGEGDLEFVDGVQQNAVLVVHGANADGVAVIPD